MSVTFHQKVTDWSAFGSILPRTDSAFISCLILAFNPSNGIAAIFVPAEAATFSFPSFSQRFHLAASLFQASPTPAKGFPSLVTPVPRLKESPLRI